ncbi:MAG: orotidine-5'-phosphate decarboxylase [Gammaproteobacteria bacterium]|nr:orotidine-5'-phosphate decarboxylase [Gammaproteobacteria bacterium]MDH5629867.1 orotidine-5'-phosphate decarboxylase [Gammaproteobacteria bacterium]
MSSSELVNSASADSKIIVALDFDNLQKAKSLVAELDPKLCKVKVGKEMFTLFGPNWVSYLVERDFQVFLDLKFHDIPNTVAKACHAAATFGVWMTNVHASGGIKMMEAAREAIAKFGSARPLLTAVTILTSMDDQQYNQIGYQRGLTDQVIHLAKMAEKAQLDGIVCSAQEAHQLRQILNNSFKLVTPGIRLATSAKDDQSRVMTPKKAILAGSSYLVIGRPITQASNPLSVLCEISENLAVI